MSTLWPLRRGCKTFAGQQLSIYLLWCIQADCKPRAPGEQVRELGVLRFGGAGAAAPLHALERPFTHADPTT